MAKKRGKGGRGRTIDKWTLKKWYNVFTSKTFNESYIGKIPCANPEDLVNRTVEIRLNQLTTNYNDSYIKLKFQITKVQGERCDTRLWGYKLTRDFIASLVHRGSSRVDGIFNITCADGYAYRISIFIVTIKTAKRSQRRAIREIAYEVLKEYAKNMSHDDYIRGIIYGKFADNIRNIAKKIYPLRECKIRSVKILNAPEGIDDKDFTDEKLDVEDIEVDLKTHGKQVKSQERVEKRVRRSKKSKENDEEEIVVEEEAEEE